MSGTVVAISIEEDRLKREAKLDRLDFELSARTGARIAVDGRSEFGWSADVVDEEREEFSGWPSTSGDCCFLCFSEKIVSGMKALRQCELTEISKSKHVEINQAV